MSAKQQAFRRLVSLPRRAQSAKTLLNWRGHEHSFNALLFFFKQIQAPDRRRRLQAA
jgi:hypothetical protein